MKPYPRKPGESREEWLAHELACSSDLVDVWYAHARRYRKALETIVKTSKIGGAVDIAREALRDRG